MPIAYSYKRFSSAAQEGNDSIRRQTAAAIAYIEDNPQLGLVLDTTLSMTDAGVSAFKGTNLKTGALSVFTGAVKAGMIPEGSYLLLESLDRFTRQQVNVAALDLLSLINSGVVVVTLHNQTVYREEQFQGTDGLVNLLGALIAMDGHHREQVTKGKRVAAAWASKFRKVGEGVILTSVCPFWLKVNDTRTAFELLPERVKIIQEIFQRRANGEGPMAIANSLTKRGVATPKRLSSTWHASAIQKVTDSDTVVGHLVNAHGDVFDTYYPKVVTLDVWQAVKALRGQKGATGASVKAHVLSGVVRHSCGAMMRRINKGDGYIRLKCVNCRIAMPFLKAHAAVATALFNLQWEAAPSEDGDERVGAEHTLGALHDDVGEAYAEWRKLKTRESKATYDLLQADYSKAKDALLVLKGKHTEVLASIEDAALLRNNGDLIKSLRAVALSVILNHELTEITLKSISGKTVVMDID
jgi:DNA invertase Pin-like site-specific DNA recombinase